jgi:hypothetical protein
MVKPNRPKTPARVVPTSGSNADEVGVDKPPPGVGRKIHIEQIMCCSFFLTIHHARHKPSPERPRPANAKSTSSRSHIEAQNHCCHRSYPTTSHKQTPNPSLTTSPANQTCFGVFLTSKYSHPHLNDPNPPVPTGPHPQPPPSHAQTKTMASTKCSTCLQAFKPLRTKNFFIRTAE